jgi:hypothetical protein
MEELWRKIERPETIPVRLEAADECYYAREYVSAGGWKASEANSLITNLKKPRERQGQPDWRYKIQAIRQFANELTQLVKEGVLGAIPCSKCRDDPAYDPRLDEVLRTLQKLNPKIIVERPIEIAVSHRPVHTGGERGVEAFYEFLRWRGLREPTEELILVDDVITTGAHFKACQRLILEHHPGMKVYGVFWAKVIWPETDMEILL